MPNTWEEKLSCALACTRCKKRLNPEDHRILSVYDHEAICLSCKKEEEQRLDYEETAKRLIGTCMAETETLYGDPGGYCYFHFYPFKC